MSEKEEQRMADAVRRSALEATAETLRDVSLVAGDAGLDEVVYALSVHTAEDEIEEYGPNSHVAWSPELRFAMVEEPYSSPKQEDSNRRKEHKWVQTLVALFATPRFAYGTCLAVCFVAVIMIFQSEKQSVIRQGNLAGEVAELTRRVEALAGKEKTLTAQIDQKDRQIALLGDRNPSQSIGENGSRTVLLGDGVKTTLSSINEQNLAAMGKLKIRTSTALSSTGVPAGISEFKILGPNRTLIATLPPELRWVKAGAEKGIRYRVSIARDIETQRVEPEGDTEKTVLKVTDRSFVPGAVYTWWVEATLKDRVIKSDVGRFQVLETQDMKLAHLVLDDEHLSHLQRAVFAASLGLLDDARAELDKVNFKRPELKKALLRTLDEARAND